MTAAPIQKAPVAAMWICMILSWILMLLPIPFTAFVAAPFNLAALILAIICLAKNRILHGVLGLIGTLVVSPILYFVGLALMMTAVAVAGSQMPATPYP